MTFGVTDINQYDRLLVEPNSVQGESWIIFSQDNPSLLSARA